MNSEKVPGCRPALAAAPRRHLFTLHYSLFTIHSQPGRKFAALSEIRPPPLLLRGEEEERPGVEEKKRLWCKPRWTRASTRWFPARWQARQKFGTNQNAPLLLFPLPLPWCAPRPWLPLWGSWHGAAVTEGATTGLASCALGGGSKAGAAAPGLGRFKGKGFLREGGNRNPPSLKRLFGDFLAAQKVTRGPGPGRPRRWLVCRKPALRARRAR